MKILALDLAKSKSAACLFDTDNGKAKFGTVTTVVSSMDEALGRWRPDRLVMEVGPIAGWVCDLAARAGIPVQVANPSTEGWRWRNVKKKTDRLDASKLALLSAADQLPQVHMPSPAVRQWRSLIASPPVLRTSLFLRLGVIEEWNGIAKIAPYLADTHG